MTERTVTTTTGQPYRSYEVTDVVDETKSSLISTEFWAYAALIAGLAIAAFQTDEIGPGNFWQWATIATVGYLISRGLAKSGSAHHTH